MLKAIYVFTRHPDVGLAEFHQHWFEVHGALHLAGEHHLLGYSQHQTLVHAYGGEPAPSHDGASIIWVDGVDGLLAAEAAPPWQAAARDGREGLPGGRPLLAYPLAIAAGEEMMVKDGDVTPVMIKSIALVARNPEVEEGAWLRHWREVHAELAIRAPGVRRYSLTPTLAAARGRARITHDGWSEIWFDDLEAFRRCLASPEWARVAEDSRTGGGGRPLFDTARRCLVIGRERHLLRPPPA